MLQTLESKKLTDNGFLPFEDLERLWRSARSESRRLIGLDWGTKQIGVAVSDRCGLIASPLTVLLYKQNKRLPPPHARVRLRRSTEGPQTRKTDEQLLDETLSDLLALLERETPLLAVGLGVPLNMNGSAGFQSERVWTFATRLRTRLCDRLNCPLVLYDERWSSRAVERLMVEADRTRTQRSRIVDAAAAAYVLQGVLDRLNRKLKEEE